VIAERYYQQGVAAELRGDISSAIAAHKQALASDPSHVHAIAALGRLRFVPPAQPFLDELRRHFTARICEVMLEIRNPCNYRCFYCVAKGHNNEPVQDLEIDKIEQIYKGIHADLIVTQLECGGGEPTVHPQFPDLIRLASKYGAVSFPSNNSQNPERWLPKETAKRILVRSALHPESESEERLERYLRYARFLMDAGCSFTATFISHPTRIAKIPEYRKRFSEFGISLVPVPFIGEYEGRSYPHAHTQEERQLLGLQDDNTPWLRRIQPHANRIRNFRGIPCLAGAQSLYITGKGDLRRCTYDLRKLDRPLEKAQPCGVKSCGCGLLLDQLNTLSTPDVHNYWGSFVGLKPVRFNAQESARSRGYASYDDAMTVEQIRMYDALMAAYGKDEYPE